MSLNRKKVAKNAYRITKVRNRTALRIRVPGGHLDAKFLPLLDKLANEYGNGTLHMTTRQGFEIPSLDWNDMPEINALIQPMIDALDLKVEVDGTGYPSAGTRNIAACIGNRVCPFANDDTTRIAKRIEREVYPHDLHFKIAVTGCPNDCIKVHMNDFGIICTTIPQYESSRCISCKACVDVCEKKVTGALSMENFDIVRDHDKCIGCGECILKCPTRALTRSEKKTYRLIIMGRTGKKNPRLAELFLKWADEDTVVQIIKNTYGFVDRYIDRSEAKEHIGYIVDRQGYAKYKGEVLEGIELNEECIVAEDISWSGSWYRKREEE